VGGAFGLWRARQRFECSLDKGSFVLATMLSNRGVVGTLSAFILFGEVAYGYAILVMALAPIFNYGFGFPLANYYRERHEGVQEEERRPWWRSLLPTRRQMPLLGVAVGLGLNLAGVERPAVGGEIFLWIVHLNAWALITPLGASINFGEMWRYLRAMWDLFAVKFAITPLIIHGLARLVGLEGVVLWTVTVLSFAPTAINAVIAVKLYRLNMNLSMTAFVVTTLVYLVLFFPLLFLLGNIAP
jgi:predicted permease